MALTADSPTTVLRGQNDLQCVFRASSAKREGQNSGLPSVGLDDAAAGSPNNNDPQRVRKAHSKSRFGCRTCKSRRLKCDELRSFEGGCRRCSNAGLQCDYILFTAKPLRLAGVNRAKFSATKNSPNDGGEEDAKPQSGSTTPGSSQPDALSMEVTRQSSPFATQLSWSPVLPIDERFMEGMPSTRHILQHFSTMTTQTVGDHKSQFIAQSRVIASALHSPYLLNAILGLAAAHMRFLLPPEAAATNKYLRVAECSHWAKSFESFRRELAGPDPPGGQIVKHRSNVSKFNMDQLLSTVMFVSMHQFSLRDDTGALADQRDASCSFVWLNKRTDRELALKWLGVQAGFKGLLPAMQPWLMESFWLPIFGAVDFTNEFSLEELGLQASCGNNHVSAGLDATDYHFVKLCNIDKDPTSGNPYYTNLEILLWCKRLRPITAESFTKLLNFVSRMTADFQSLLLDLDTAALLVLAHWLTLFHEIGQWWIIGRCEIEIREIVRFLSLQEDGDGRIRFLLREPAAVVGLEA